MKKLVLSLLSQKRIAGGAAVLAATQLIASACGFFRDQAFSIMFPLDSDPLGVASVYIAAFRPSDLLFQITVMSSLSVVVVPFLASHLAHGRREEMDRFLTSTMLVFSLVFGAGAIILAIFFRDIAPTMVKFRGESLELYIRFGRIALLTNFLFVFGNALGQYLIAQQRYWMYGLTPILWAMGTILGTYFLTPVFGPLGPMYGTVIGTLGYVLLRGYAVIRAGYRPILERGSLLHAELKDMGLLIIPRMAALGALQLQLLLLDRLASGLQTEMVALNQFARNFESVIPGIVGIAIAQSAFSLLSQSAALKDTTRFKDQVKKGLIYNFMLAVPGSVALAACSGIAAWLIHLGPSVSGIFILSLLIYSLAVPFDSTNHIMLRTFYALKNTVWPAASSVVSGATAVIAGTLLLPTLGIYALAWAYVLGQAMQTLFLTIALGYLMQKRLALPTATVVPDPLSTAS